MNDPEWHALTPTLPADVLARYNAEVAKLSGLCRYPWSPRGSGGFIPEREIVGIVMKMRREIAGKLAVAHKSEEAGK